MEKVGEVEKPIGKDGKNTENVQKKNGTHGKKYGQNRKIREGIYEKISDKMANWRTYGKNENGKDIEKMRK